MGLDTTHDCWHGSYGAFNVFREEIAKAINVPLGLMEGFYEPTRMHHLGENSPLWVSESLENNLFTYLPISWDMLKPDAIYILLHHSDCDGEIAVKDQIGIAERLEAIAPYLPSDGTTRFDVRAKALQFAKGLREANSLNEPVEFQ